MTVKRELIRGGEAREGAGLASSAVWPFFDAEERAAVDSVLASGRVNYWTGDIGRHFELEYARSLGVRKTIAVANGSVALETVLRMWNIGPGDEVVVTPRSFIASVSAVVLLGARPVFADVDRSSGNITADSVARVLTSRTKAVVPVHLAGWPCDMKPIMELAEERGIRVLEDCAQAHGAKYDGRSVGALAHAGAFSFCQDKIISTGGEGGLISTDDDDLWDRCWSFKDHGKTWQAVYEREHGPGFRWVHDRFGTNLRMTEVQAAIGRLQLKKLDQWVEIRRRNAATLARRFGEESALRMPSIDEGRFFHSYYKFYAFIDPERLKPSWTRDRIVSEIVAKGVPCFSGGCSEIYRERAFVNMNVQPQSPLPVAAGLGATSLMFLVHPTLSDEDMHVVADVATDVLQGAVL